MLLPDRRAALRELLLTRTTWTLEELASQFWGVKEADVPNQWWRHVRGEIGHELKRAGWARVSLGKVLGEPKWAYQRRMLDTSPKTYRAQVADMLPGIPDERMGVLFRLTVLAGRRDPKSCLTFARVISEIEAHVSLEAQDAFQGRGGGGQDVEGA